MFEVAAMPIVGNGNAYRNLQGAYSGANPGFALWRFYLCQRWLLLKDIQAGLLGGLPSQHIFDGATVWLSVCIGSHATRRCRWSEFCLMPTGRPFVFVYFLPDRPCMRGT